MRNTCRGFLSSLATHSKHIQQVCARKSPSVLSVRELALQSTPVINMLTLWKDIASPSSQKMNDLVTGGGRVEMPIYPDTDHLVIAGVYGPLLLFWRHDSSLPKSFFAQTSWQGGEGADGMPVWLPNDLIPFLYIIIISLIDSLRSSISISNSYIAHIKCWLCMNPQGQYFIYPPFAQSDVQVQCVCVCVLYMCICRCVGVIRGQLMIKGWLDLDQEHCGWVTFIRLEFKA